MIERMRLSALVLMAIVTACTIAGDALQPTPTAVRVEPPIDQSIVVDDITTCGATDMRVASRHEIDATVDYTARTVSAVQTVTYSNRTGQPLNDVVFSVEANREPRVFTLSSITFADGSPAAFELVGKRLTVDLPAALEPGCAVSLTLTFDLRVPPVQNGVRAFRGYLGYTDRQINLANWLPTVAARPGGDWLVPDAALVGEQQVADVADWNLTLSVQNAPAELQIAAPGAVRTADDGSIAITHERARELAISLSDQFRLHSRTSGSMTVELYTFADTLVQTPDGVVDGAQSVLDAAVDAIGMFSDLFGPMNPDRLVIVEGDFPDGMEFSGLVFVSRDWFRTFNGTPQSYLIIIAVHEIAHQWWYARVGSDSANAPWLDEALATYSEYIYYEEFHPDLRDWWWSFRVDRFAPPDYQPAGSVGSSVYRFGTIREYINAVYLRGARMLHALRTELGTDAFFALLRRYADAGADRVVDADIFWGLLTPEQHVRIARIRDRYFGGQ
ncbi:MAG: M1 family metallopeptidase [Candidatus Flexifilum sp.]